jgi:hypothetical protein
MRFASRCERSALMTREATFLVQAFNDFKGERLKPSRPVACKSADGARRTAPHSETEDYDDQPTIFYRAGRLPVEFDSKP